MTTATQNHTEGTTAPDLTTTAGKLADLRSRLAETNAPMGQAAIERSHDAGKKTARERIEYLLDDDSFVEVDALARHRSKNFGLDAKRPVTDGVVIGYGTIDGRKVCVFSQDGAIFGGALGEVYGEKIVKIMDLAIKTGVPLIGINQGHLGFLTQVARENMLEELAGMLTGSGERRTSRTVRYGWTAVWIIVGLAVLRGALTLPGAVLSVLLGRLPGLVPAPCLRRLLGSSFLDDPLAQLRGARGVHDDEGVQLGIQVRQLLQPVCRGLWIASLSGFRNLTHIITSTER